MDENNCKVEETIKNIMFRRVDLFIEAIRDRIGSIPKLYETGKTRVLLKERGTNLKTFQKNVYRMREGIGILNDPVLLTAILEDMGYSAHCLFNNETTPSTSSNNFLSQETVKTFENIIYRAVQDAQNPITRIAKIEKRLISAQKVHKMVTILSFSNNFSTSIYWLFFNYSRISPQLYKHKENNEMRSINILVKYINNLQKRYGNVLKNTPEINENFGKLLSLCYVIFEVTKICKSYINYSIRNKNHTLSLNSKYEGFIFPENCSILDFEKNISQINRDLELTVNYATNNGNMIFNNENHIINLSLELLFKLLQKDINNSINTKTLTQDELNENILFSPDFSLKNVFNTRIRYVCKIDDSLISLVNKLKNSLHNLNKINTEAVGNPNDREIKKSIFNKTNNNDKLNDEIDNVEEEDLNDGIDNTTNTDDINDYFRKHGYSDDEEIYTENNASDNVIDGSITSNKNIFNEVKIPTIIPVSKKYRRKNNAK